MFLGLRTIIYPTSDLKKDTAFWSDILELEPYFDQPFYVGFNVGGYELGLDPNGQTEVGMAPVTYWGVADINKAVRTLKDKGVHLKQDIQEVGDTIKTALFIDASGHVFGVIENPHFNASMKPIKNSVAVVIKNNQGQFLVVKRPEYEDGPLAGVWGFPAITLHENESEQDAILRTGRTKLGVALEVNNKIGERTADRGSYVLHLSDYSATIVGDNTPSVPQSDTSMTQYDEFKYTSDPAVLFPAAQNGSLCSQVYLSSIGADWDTPASSSRTS